MTSGKLESNLKNLHGVKLQSQRSKYTHKVIGHEELCFVVISGDVVFLHQNLNISVHVHLLDGLLYLPMALEYAGFECISVRLGFQRIPATRTSFQTFSHGSAFDRSWTSGGCISSDCCTALPPAASPAPG